MKRLRLEGAIAASGFESGDRFVVGIWDAGPLGPMNDVMWAGPNDKRTLLAPSPDAAEFVAGIYTFEHVEVVDVFVHRAGERIGISAGPVCLDLWPGATNPLFALRPRPLRRSALWVRFEDAALRASVGRYVLGGADGVRSYGRTASGVREWYCIDSYQPLRAAGASIEGADLGGMGPLEPRVSFGISEFPRRPALVGCAPLLEGAERFLPGRS